MKKIFSLVVFAFMVVQVALWAQDAAGTDSAEGAPAASPASPAATRPATASPVAANRGDPLPDDSDVQAAISAGNADQLYKWMALKGQGQAYDTFRLRVRTSLNWYINPDKSVEPYRNGKMNARVRDVPVELISQVFTAPETTLPDVVNALIAKNSSPFEKTKILHDWICDNISYDADLLSSGSTDNQDYASVLKKKMALCSGYSNLMKEMCDIAGIEAKVINGCLKDTAYGYDPSKGIQNNHAWNAVKLGPKWYIVDCTLDAGYVDGKAAIRKYSTDYLFPDSRSFLYSHFAEKPEEQYYGPALNADTFVNEAFIPGSFFRYGLKLAANKPLYTNTAQSEVFMFDMNAANGTIIMSNTISPSSGNRDEAWTMKRGSGGSIITAGYLLPDKNSGSQSADANANASTDANASTGGAQGSQNGEYTCTLYARNKDSVSFKMKVATEEYNIWSEKIKALKDKGDIGVYELSVFKSAYYKVDANDAYYFLDDQFAIERNNIVQKIYGYLNISLIDPEKVLSFTLKDG
ncbi:MAG: hypothetical protein LBM77_11790 [Spirochaetaceae bacterium]|jgi:transglutaminase/protease-like cytokinesis protein 3|nr:hypothetical protein [Spirochaetaceae bacterium]